MSRTPAVVTSAMMWEELQTIKAQLAKLTKNTLVESIQEISLRQACLVLKLGKVTVVKLIESGDLKARRYKDQKGNTRYRIRLIDLKEFQEFARVNEDAVKERLELEELKIKEEKSKASSDYMAWAKNEVEKRKIMRESKQQKKGKA